ncbi:MAG: response regulator [Selenomonadaceae bacterium]|nr:response regulator [Selenomonadaceae bacterium]
MRKKVILIIDDDEMNLQIAKMVLEKRLPCEVIAVNSGLKGLEVLRTKHVNLVLLDILMPEVDGIETLRRIREDESLRGLSVMMLTASGDMDNVRRAVELGVKDYIRKPFMPKDFVERIRKKLEEIHSEEVLLIGDDENTLQDMKVIIESNFPHEALIATSYAAATKYLDEVPVKLIIACADMKFVNGFKILVLIASDEKYSSIPFALTSTDKLLDLIDKTVDHSAEEEEEEEEVYLSEEGTSVHPNKKIANVVTSVIGYKLDVNI